MSVRGEGPAAGTLLGAAALVVATGALWAALSADAGGRGAASAKRAVGNTKVVTTEKQVPASRYFDSAKARCPKGMVAIAGGFDADGDLTGSVRGGLGTAVVRSYPSPTEPRDWRVGAIAHRDAVNRGYAVYAVCAKGR
jgi:hypothetical protein